ncbi:MAG: TonB-dependent receptor [Cytophagaceae bacterium]|jgi:hypothetical protein|nr:TonB-dependent receptor [Cytophagaceae bacterium]
MKQAFTCIFFFLIAQGTMAQQLSQTVRGTVVDKDISTPLMGVRMVLRNATQTLETVSDTNGIFILPQVAIGRQEIQYSKEGYKSGTLSIQVESGKESVLEIFMEENFKVMKEVSVLGKRDKNQAQNALITNSVQVLRAEDVNRFAGSRNDPSRMASSYAGVGGAGDQRNDIIVRGNSPIGVLWRMEGVDIYNPNHFTFTGNSGGAFAVLNNNLLANSDFLTGAFPAEYGNRTAAVFDVRLRKGNNNKRENTIQIGLSGLEYLTEGPFTKKSKASYVVSYRFFTFGALEKLGVSIGANGIPQYHDVNFKIHIPTNKMGTFTVWGIGGKSKIDLTYPQADTIIRPVSGYSSRFTSDMAAAGISHEHRVGMKTKAKLSYSFSGAAINYLENADYTDKSLLEVEDLRNAEGHHLFQYVVTHKFNARRTLRTGITARRLFYKNYEQYYSEDDSLSHVGWDNQGHSWLTQAYVHWNEKISEKVEMNAGLYSQYFALSKSSTLEPRLGIVFQANDKTTWSLSSGMHSQTLPLFMYQYKVYDEKSKQYLAPNQRLDLMRSLHVVAGYKRALTSQLRLKAEAYYQYLYRVPVSENSGSREQIYSVINTGASYTVSPIDSLVNKGLGRNYGAEVTLERFFNKDYYFLSTVSVFRSEYQGNDQQWRRTAFDLGHVVNGLAGKEFHLDKENRRTISLDIKMTHSGGRRIIPVDVAASKAAGEQRLRYNEAYDQKVKAYFRTDIKISYNVNRAKASHNFFIAADNVSNRQNVLTEFWDSEKGEVRTEYQLGIFPYLGYKVNF